MNLLELLHSMTNKSEFFFNIKKLCSIPFPEDGTTTELDVLSSGKLTHYSFHNEPDLWKDNYFVKQLINTIETLTPNWFTDIFCSVVQEQQCLFISDDITKLSGIIPTLSLLLKPFEWQHVSIPILPTSLFNYVSAPMPFLMGCLRSTFNKISRSNNINTNNIYIFDIDRKCYIHQPSPTPLNDSISKLRFGLYHCFNNDKIRDSVTNIIKKFYFEMFGKFINCFTTDEGVAQTYANPGLCNFDKKLFISTFHDDDMIQFIENVENSQMFLAITNEVAKQIEEEKIPINPFQQVKEEYIIREL